MAIAERFLAERFNRPGHEVVDHHTYAICSDGDMMEGVSQEAASIAGHFGLGKLIVCYDDNRITIDGSTAISFDGENHTERMAADGWHVQRVEDSEDLDALTAALSAARDEPERPSFIAIRSHIAYPAPNAVDTAAAHGAPLGEEEVRATKVAMGFEDPERTFWVDERVGEHMSLRRGRRERAGALAGALRAVARGACRSWPPSGIWPGRARACARAGARRCRQFEAGNGDRHALGRAEDDGGLLASTPRRRSAGPPIWWSRPRPCSRAPASSRGRTPDATCRSASASTRWARSSTARPRTAGSSNRTARRS